MIRMDVVSTYGHERHGTFFALPRPMQHNDSNFNFQHQGPQCSKGRLSVAMSSSDNSYKLRNRRSMPYLFPY
eukprot:c10461_g1_i2 orf=66-281(+)